MIRGWTDRQGEKIEEGILRRGDGLTMGKCIACYENYPQGWNTGSGRRVSRNGIHILAY